MMMQFGDSLLQNNTKTKIQINLRNENRRFGKKKIATKPNKEDWDEGVREVETTGVEWSGKDVFLVDC